MNLCLGMNILGTRNEQSCCRYNLLSDYGLLTIVV
jgi:hypothetical protein